MIKNASYVFPSVLNLFGMFKALCVKHWRFSKHLKSQNKTLKLHLGSKHNFVDTFVKNIHSTNVIYTLCI